MNKKQQAKKDRMFKIKWRIVWTLIVIEGILVTVILLR